LLLGVLGKHASHGLTEADPGAESHPESGYPPLVSGRFPQGCQLLYRGIIAHAVGVHLTHGADSLGLGNLVGNLADPRRGLFIKIGVFDAEIGKLET
jgi:hypothetical protein